MQSQFDENEKDNGCRKIHFHVTYWMFYPFSEGKTICVLDLGFFGSWPIPTVGGVCLGTLKEYGSHIGDWEHMSLYFKVNDCSLLLSLFSSSATFQIKVLFAFTAPLRDIYFTYKI